MLSKNNVTRRDLDYAHVWTKNKKQTITETEWMLGEKYYNGDCRQCFIACATGIL